jgi:dihydroorotate dehydrogenase
MTLYSVLRPLLMTLDAETAHRLALRALKAGFGPRGGFTHAALETRLWGHGFANPLGLAAGFDKDAEALPALFRLGFGFVEAGTVTPLAQEGNPRPRVFRDAASGAVVNRMGFPGRGHEAFAANLAAARRARLPGLVGVNIGVNKESASPAADYARGLTRLSELADYVAVNVSSPNTAGLRDLQRREALNELLGRLGQARDPRVPLLVKVAPDLSPEERADIAALALAHGIDGLIVSNTTVTRPEGLPPWLRDEKGGLSGRPLLGLATAALGDFYRLTGGKLPLVGVGGVAGAEDAYAKIRAGASLVQVYSALVFKGPALVPGLLEGLARLLARDGFTTVAEAVGADHAAPEKSRRKV